MLEPLYSLEYNNAMYTIKTLPEFDDWLSGLKDSTTRLRLAKRLDKAARGLLGDVKPLGGFPRKSRSDFRGNPVKACMKCVNTSARATACITQSAKT